MTSVLKHLRTYDADRLRSVASVNTRNALWPGRDQEIVTRTNHNGGINGGISNGMPVLFRCAVKPTPSIYKEQDTADFFTLTEKKILISGRHDPAIIHRARIVVGCVTALVLCDLLTQRFGTDYLASKEPQR